MAFITDFTLLNAAGTSGDWTASGFDSPTLNDSSATTPIYIEASSCMWWPLKKGTTDGYVYDNLATAVDLTGRLIVGWLNYPFADITNIPINELFIQVSSDTGLNSTNWSAWDAKAQLIAPYNTPISGHTPIMAYPTNPDESAGTTVFTSIDSIGWRATTGSTADGKQGGFDMFLAIGWIGEHSETFINTFFDDLYEESYDSDGGGIPGTANRPLGIISRSGNFFQTNVNIQIGDGTSDTADIIVNEENKFIYYNNVEPEQNLGYVFVNPASSYWAQLWLKNCGHLWNQQSGTNPQIFKDASNLDSFRIDGGNFSVGGNVSLPAHSASQGVSTVSITAGGSGYSVNDILTGVSGTGTKATFRVDSVSTGAVTAVSILRVGGYTVDPSTPDTTTVSPAGGSGCTLTYVMDYIHYIRAAIFDNNKEIDIGDLIFENNTVSNAVSGVFYDGTGTRRIKNTSYSNNVDATHFDTAQTISMDGDQFSNNLYDVHFSGTGTLTINAINGANPSTSRVSGGGTVVINNTVSISIEVIDSITKAAIQNAHVLLLADTGGSLPVNASVSITRSGSTATVTHTAHGLATGNKVKIDDADQSAYKGIKTITVTGTNTYTFTVIGTPTTPATGSIKSTAVVLEGYTNASGLLEDTGFNYVSSQPVVGDVKKATSSPVYITGSISGAVSTAGYSTTVPLISDE